MWKRCAPLTPGLWTTLVLRQRLGVGCVETSSTSGLPYFVWLYIRQSQGLIQVLRTVVCLLPSNSLAEVFAAVLMASRLGRGHRDSATAAVAEARRGSQERSPETALKQEREAAVGCRRQPTGRGSAEQSSYPDGDGLSGTGHHRRLDPTAHVKGGRADIRPGHGQEGPRPRVAHIRAQGRRSACLPGS
jgi:hypothetical protein